MYDELVKRIWECASGECFNCSQYTETTNASVCSKELMKQAADAIEELQKAVPKSGVWREEESGYDDVFYECSVCGAGVCIVDGDPVDNAWSYCPECGAKMTGVERLPEPPKEE